MKGREQDSAQCPVKGPGADVPREREECPVKKVETTPPSFFGSLMSYFGGQSREDSHITSSSNPSDSSSSCGYNAAANDLVFGHQPQPDQKTAMSQKRTISSIPKSDYTPNHQPSNQDNWVYPSQQQYYNAMKRKGYDPAEEDVAVVLKIHNIVNERGWSQIKEWESLRGCNTPKLKQFEGRPRDISPKAYIKSLLGYKLPFDRHDWVVDSNGNEVRYVIDFYQGKPTPEAPISMHLDVRPALDSPYSFYHRVKYNMYEMLEIPKVPQPQNNKSSEK